MAASRSPPALMGEVAKDGKDLAGEVDAETGLVLGGLSSAGEKGGLRPESLPGNPHLLPRDRNRLS